ncbi:MAG: metallophosphoesterase [Victivallales bacterium]
MKDTPLTFVQFSDIHLGKSLVFPESVIQQIRQNFTTALDELERLEPDFLLVSGDAVNTGLADIDEYLGYISRISIPVHHIPSSHDLALGPLPDGGIILNDDPGFWEEKIGPARVSFTCKGVKFIFFEPFRKISEKKGLNIFDADIAAWLSGELGKISPQQPLVIGYHIPVLASGETFSGWQNAEEFFSLLQGYNVVNISGHRHRNDETMIRNIRQIQTGSLAGFQWNGLPPHYMFPVRPGYRIFQFHQSSWYSFFKEIGVKNQIVLEKINNIHTLGPRPQVRPAILSSDAELLAKVYSEDAMPETVEYSLDNKNWNPLEKKNDFLWSEWSARIPHGRFHEKFNVITIRAGFDNQLKIYDSVPVFVQPENEPTTAMQSGPEMLFELLTDASERVSDQPGNIHSFPWIQLPHE